MRQIASIAGCTEHIAVRLLEELAEAGVFSRSPEGVIYSRRMVRDAAASDAGRAAITKRWERPAEPNRPPNRTPDSLYSEAVAEIPATLAPRPASQPQSARQLLWRDGLPVLQHLTGLPEKSARRFLGDLLRTAEDDAAGLLHRLLQAQTLHPVADARAYLMAAAKALGRAGSADRPGASNWALDELRAGREGQEDAVIVPMRGGGR